MSQAARSTGSTHRPRLEHQTDAEVAPMNVTEMLSDAREAITVKRVYGEPIEREGLTIVPAADVRGGGGGGSDSANNGGGGFGLTARPVGVYIVKDGQVEWEPAVDASRIAIMGMVTSIVALLVLRSIVKALASR
jgi:uncharacterized spore protein YtfJ